MDADSGLIIDYLEQMRTAKMHNDTQGILGAKEHKFGVARPEKRKAEEGRVNLLNKMKEQMMLKIGKVITRVQQKIDDAAAMRMARNNALHQMMRRKYKKMFGQLNIARPLDMAIPDDLIQKAKTEFLFMKAVCDLGNHFNDEKVHLFVNF
uniref:Uncharacterized protein n=1 Tax=Globodera rostochiensis TaxID=31243 RepID=A0A914HTS0_GLORO